MSDKVTKQKFLVDLFSRAPIKKTFGMDISYDESDSAVFTMPYNPDFNHALMQVHGGVFATLLDNAGWFTVALHYDTWISTAEMQVRLLEPVAEKSLIARASLLKKGKKLAMAEMEVLTEDGILVAAGSATFAVTTIPYSNTLF